MEDETPAPEATPLLSENGYLRMMMLSYVPDPSGEGEGSFKMHDMYVHRTELVKLRDAFRLIESEEASESSV